MNKFYPLFFAIFITFSSFAQNNQGFKYQAIIRDAAGNVNANASVQMEISILQGAADGTSVFTENHAVVSNTYGLVNLTIGSQNPTDFSLIDWANSPYFIKIVVDGVEFGTSQLLSVPYALHAKSSEKATIAETAENYTETDPLFTASTAATITQTQIENWTNKLSEFAETDPDFNASIAAGITLTQIESWTNKLDAFLETDPEFAASLAKGITTSDTAYWNSKLDNFVESDPTFLAHPSAGITANDITMWKALWIWYTTNANGYQKISDDGDVDATNEIQSLAEVLTINDSANSQIKNLSNPIDAQDAATKSYVDALETKLLIFLKVQLISGVSVADLLSAGVSVPDLLLAGGSISDLFSAGVSVPDLLSAGVSVSDLLSAGASVSVLLSVGVGVPNLIAAGANDPVLIGLAYNGGKIAYILQNGDPGYVAGETHGIIAAPSDQNTGIQWYNGTYTEIETTSTELGTGNANTNNIIAIQGAGSYAAQVCANLVLGGYSDWYLPSRDELIKLHINKTVIGGFANDYYWSSSDDIWSSCCALSLDFRIGFPIGSDKKFTIKVRAVRAF